MSRTICTLTMDQRKANKDVACPCHLPRNSTKYFENFGGCCCFICFQFIYSQDSLRGLIYTTDNGVNGELANIKKYELNIIKSL